MAGYCYQGGVESCVQLQVSYGLHYEDLQGLTERIILSSANSHLQELVESTLDGDDASPQCHHDLLDFSLLACIGGADCEMSIDVSEGRERE